MNRNTKLEALKAYFAHLREERESGSTGTVGKAADVLVRDYVMARGIRDAADLRCRPASKTDWTIRVSGRIIRGETKTAAGGWKVAEPGIRAEDIYPNADYIAYAAEVDGMTEDNLPDTMFIFTREQFIDLLTATGKNGLQSSLKYNINRGTVEIQAWTVFNKKTGKWVSRRLDRYYDFLEENDIPTLREWVEAVRG